MTTHNAISYDETLRYDSLVYVMSAKALTVKSDSMIEPSRPVRMRREIVEFNSNMFLCLCLPMHHFDRRLNLDSPVLGWCLIQFRFNSIVPLAIFSRSPFCLPHPWIPSTLQRYLILLSSSYIYTFQFSCLTQYL